MNKTVIIIPARYNSSRLKGKPLIEIKGVPLIKIVYNKLIKIVSPKDVYITSENIKVLKIFNKNENNLIILFISLFIFAYFIKTLFILFYNFFRIKFCNSLFVDLSNKILNNYLSQKYNFFVNNNSSKLVRNIVSETNLFGLSVVGSLIEIISQIIIIVSFCLFLVTYNFIN